MSLIRLFSFRGRIGRKAFFVFAIGLCLLSLLLRTTFELALHSLEPKYTPKILPTEFYNTSISTQLAQFLLVLDTTIFIFLFFSLLSVLIRRFHDMNLSGWLAVFSLCLVQAIPDFKVHPMFSPLGATALTILLVLFRGTDGTNKYGPSDPSIDSLGSNGHDAQSPPRRQF